MKSHLTISETDSGDTMSVKKSVEKNEVCILLPDIRSVYNAGAIFRTADAMGVSKIYLSGFTPMPVDRFGVARNDFAKSALGAEKTVAWEYVKSPGALITRLKKDGFRVLAVEQNAKSVDYKKVKPPSKMLVIFGTEVSGISKSILKKADIIAEIPMKGDKESLNVSVSAGIVLFRWFDK